jgi:hypothetical protein
MSPENVATIRVYYRADGFIARSLAGQIIGAWIRSCGVRVKSGTKIKIDPDRRVRVYFSG